MNNDKYMTTLVGKVITGLRINDDQSLLVFDHPDNSHTAYETEADCCSETWFADIVGVDALIGSTVLKADAMEAMQEVVDGRCRQDYDLFYGVKLITTNGYVDIVYRNSSNGYYGGSIDLYTRKLPSGLQSIIEDYQS